MDGPYHFSGWGGSGHEYGEASGGGGCFGRPSTSDSDFLSEFLDPLSPDLSPHVTTSRGAILQAHVSRMHHDDGGGSGGGGGSVRVNNDDEVESSRTKDGHDGKQQPDTSKMGASGSFDSRHKRKRNRTTEMHNMTERRRRDKIKVKLKALQELIPNCHKLDRAALLDEIIAYVKSLQMQVQMMQCGGICHSPYMTHSPCLHMPHMPRISPFSHMAMSYGMGLGSMACPVPPPMMSIPSPHPPTTFVPLTRYDTISAICPLSQPVLYAPMATSIPSPPVLQSGPFTSHRGSTTVSQEEATKENPSVSEPISTAG